MYMILRILYITSVSVSYIDNYTVSQYLYKIFFKNTAVLSLLLAKPDVRSFDQWISDLIVVA